MIIPGVIASSTSFHNYSSVGSPGYTGNVVSGAAPVVAANSCLLYTSPSPRDRTRSRMPSSA